MTARPPARVSADDLIDRWQSAWASQDRGAFRPLCAPDVHYEDPIAGTPLVGPDELADHAARLWTAFPDVRVERTGQRLTDGRYVAAPCRVLGTHRGELPDLPPSGRFVVLQLVFFCELDADRHRLWRIRAFFDGYDAAVQIGMLPARGTLGERALMLLRGFGLRARG